MFKTVVIAILAVIDVVPGVFAATNQPLKVVDGHNDLPWAIRQSKQNLKDINLLQDQKKFHTDIKRLIKGGVGLQLWSAYVPASTDQSGTAKK